MRILVTRPREDAAPLAAVLKSRGHSVTLAPMLEIAVLPDLGPLDLGGVQANLFTSANGVRAFARLSPDRDLPAFAVGDASARGARSRVRAGRERRRRRRRSGAPGRGQAASRGRCIVPRRGAPGRRRSEGRVGGRGFRGPPRGALRGPHGSGLGRGRAYGPRARES